MRFSAATLDSIEARASTLSERIRGQFVQIGGGTDLAARRLERINQVVAGDEQPPLAMVLAAFGASEGIKTGPSAVLGSVKRNPAIPAARWTYDLNLIAEAIAQFSSANSCERALMGRGRAPSKNVPYEHLYLPIVKFAWAQVVLKCPIAAIRFRARARFGLQKYLLHRLASILSAVMHPAFLAHQSFAGSAMMQHLFSAGTLAGTGEKRTRQYEKFVAEQREDGLGTLFTNFPTAARLVAEVTRCWIEFVAEFLERLRLDEKKIAARFNHGVPLNDLVSVRAGLSDPHHGGRSVLILAFRGGLQVVYKPRSMRIDHVFNELISSINDRSPRPGFRALRVLDQTTHGWMEFVRNAACSSNSAAERYFRRAGGLACLTHWLQGIDFHRENVVAAGEHPVLIDLECLAHPLRPDEAPASTQEQGDDLMRSVLRTGLLPIWQSPAPGGQLYDVCGLNGTVKRWSLFPAIRWKEINSDRMHWVQELRCQRHSAHRASLFGRLLRIRDFEDEVLAGYDEMAAMLENRRDDALAEHRMQLYQAGSRRIKRPTFVYALLLQHSLKPQFLADGIERSIELLSLPRTAGDEADWLAEVASLERLDVPYFSFPPGSKNGLPPARSVSTSQPAAALQQSIRGNAKLSGGKIVPLRLDRRSAYERRRIDRFTPGASG